MRVLDNFATGRRSNLRVLDDAAEVVEGDIQSYERVSRAVTGCEAVLHEAALPSVPRSIQDPLTSNATNVIGTLNVLLAARDHGVRRVVLASSSSVYGTKPRLPKQEDDPALPISPYASTKLAGRKPTLPPPPLPPLPPPPIRAAGDRPRAVQLGDGLLAEQPLTGEVEPRARGLELPEQADQQHHRAIITKCSAGSVSRSRPSARRMSL